ncbi:MAG: PQQ-dependent sugar dehydrogenase [Cyanobacteria bacterium P01_F01_bin.42]
MHRRTMQKRWWSLMAAGLVACSPVGADRGSRSQFSEPVAIAGQTKIFQSTLLSNLEHPWGLTWMSADEILITLRPGRFVQYSLTSQTSQPIEADLDIFAAGQGGLLDVVAHPEFEQNRWIYVSYSQGDRRSNRTVVARAKLRNNQLSDWETIFAVADSKSGTQHFGSRLLWLPDRTLLVSIGDGGNPPLTFEGELIRTQAQNLSTHFGKVIRINDDGSVPADNPFAARPQAQPEIWSYGHRNIQGMAIDPQTGALWSTEHGARGGDELNLLGEGQNYGWPLASFSREYTVDRPVAPSTSRPDSIAPMLVWTPAIAPSGLAVYRGDRYPEWQGNLFAGALVGQSLIRISVNGQRQVEQREDLPIGQRVRDIQQGPDGYLYILTDSRDGRLLRLEPEANVPSG